MSASARAWLDQQPLEPDYSRFDGCDEAPEPLAPAPAVQYATGDQKTAIIRLLNRPEITRAEKTKMLSSINKFSEARATEAIANLTAAVAERGTLPALRERLQAGYAGRAMQTTTSLNTRR